MGARTGMRRMGSDLHSHNGYLYTFRMLYTVTYLCILWYRLHKGTVAGQHAHFEAMVQATAVLTCVCPKSGHFLRIVPRPRRETAHQHAARHPALQLLLCWRKTMCRQMTTIVEGRLRADRPRLDINLLNRLSIDERR